MAGAKGRSGGARVGAGRKPKADSAKAEALAQAAAELPDMDAVEFLQQVMLGKIQPTPAQLSAASTLVRAAAAGKKEARQAAAEEAVKGRFKPSEPPRLVASRA